MQGNEFGSIPLEPMSMTIATDDASPRESSCAMMLPTDSTIRDTSRLIPLSLEKVAFFRSKVNDFRVIDFSLEILFQIFIS